MAAASATATFACSPDQFFRIVTDYEKYPEFLSDVKQCNILETKGNQKLVEMQISIIKPFNFRIWITEDPPKRMSWTLESGGNLFKTSIGSWDLSDLGGKTEAKYSLDVTFNMFVPGPVAKALIKGNLPNMMEAYQQRVKQKYGQ